MRLMKMFASQSESDASDMGFPPPSRGSVAEKARSFCSTLPLSDGNQLPPGLTKATGYLASKQRILSTYLSIELDTILKLVQEITLIGKGADRLRNEFHIIGDGTNDDGNMKVRLVLSEGRSTAAFQNPQGFLSPVLSDIPVDFDTPFPCVYSALIIGPFYLEWNESSLCIPRRCYGNAMSVIGESIYLGECSINDLSKVADIIVEFNTKRWFSQYNPQHFVDAVIDQLRPQTPFPPLKHTSLSLYLSEIRESGFGSAALSIHDDHFDSGGTLSLVMQGRQRVVFDTHSLLDQLAQALLFEASLGLSKTGGGGASATTRDEIQRSSRNTTKVLELLDDDNAEFEMKDELLLLRAIDACFWRRFSHIMEEEWRKTRRGMEANTSSIDTFKQHDKQCPFVREGDALRTTFGNKSI